MIDEYHALLRSHTDAAEYDILLRQEHAPAALRATAGAGVREAEFANEQRLDLEGLLGRAYSSSCVRHGIKDAVAFEQDMANLYRRHERVGQVTLDYRSVALCWQPHGPVAA